MRAGHTRISGQHQKWIKHDSDLEPIRSHPRYQNVLKLIG
jgi:hypothetical protein